METYNKTCIKLMVSVCVFGIFLYYKGHADSYGTVKVDFKKKLESFPGLSERTHEDVDVYRLDDGYKSRQLKYLKHVDVRTQFNYTNEGTQLLPPYFGNFQSLTDDPDDSADCSDVHKVNMSDRCHFVNTTDSCQVDEGFFDYTYFVYCDFPSNLLPLACVLILLWWLFLFIGLAITADDFFCPSLSVISDTMRLSHNIAGVTFLAFGNGAPDIFSAIAAIGNAKNGDAGLAIGALFGAGVFVTTIVAGTIAIICPFDAMQRPFLRDVIFYLGSVFWTFYVLWDKKITKLESIGFIIAYVVYVLVVVIGRYIYTRTNNSSESSYRPVSTESHDTESRDTESRGTESHDTESHDTESHDSPSTNQEEDSAIASERQPLLTNPDIISLSAVRDETPLQEFLHQISPIDTETWSGMNIPRKLYEVFKCPMLFLLKITVPVVNYEEDKQNWNRHLYCLQCILGPVFCVLATKVGFYTMGAFPVWGLTLILAFLLSVLVFCTSRNEVRPKYNAAFAYLGFVVAVVWIYSIANEIVNILQTLGIVFNISNAILGLTLLAWGNSIGDFIADTVMARQGFPRMGISACFGGPLFNTLLGIGIPFTIATVKNGDYELKITLEEVILAAFLVFSLVSSLVIVICSKFRMTRGWGIYLCVLYVVFLIVAILTETGVIHAKIDNNSS